MLRHGLVILACLAGVYGMGTVFTGAMHGSLVEVSRGVPPLLLGGWWAGRALGLSLLGSKATRNARR